MYYKKIQNYKEIFNNMIFEFKNSTLNYNINLM